MSGYQLIQKHYEELLRIMDCIKVGIYITDGDGNTLLVNRESEKTGGLSREDLDGKNMEELINIGYVTDSSVVKVIKSRSEENIIQQLGEGGQVFITGVPLMQDGKIDLIICTERDITETINLEQLLKQTEEKAERYGTELEYHRKRNLAESEIVYKSFEMKTVVEKAMRIARIDATVLLTGESGTGKELVANLVYKYSKRNDKPFIKVNCAAVPENLLESEFFGYEAGSFSGAHANGKAGIFELVNGGTLFLDEIGDLPIQLQSKLLRAIQEKEIRRIGGSANIPVDVRIIAATNIDLVKAVEEGKFREDLFYRLNVIPIQIPPLRQRKEDIEELALYFVNKFSKEYKIKKDIIPEAVNVLKNYEWPGNIRELKNVIERIFVAYEGAQINKFQAQSQLLVRQQIVEEKRADRDEGTLQERIEAYEMELLTDLLSKHKPARVAHILKVNKSTISRKMKKYNIEVKP